MAYRFTRASFDYISYSHLTALDADVTVSLSVWLKAGSTGTSAWDRVISLAATTGGYGWSLGRYSTVARQFQIALAPASPYSDTYLTSGTAATLETWQHWFIRIDGNVSDNTIVRLWIDGVEHTAWVHRFTGPTTLGTNTSPFIVGSSKVDGTGATFEGEIAEVAIWTDAITNAAQITELAAGYLPPTVVPTNLVFYAPLRTDATDVVGSRVGTVSGAVLSTHPASVQVYGGSDVPTLSVRVQESQVDGATF